MILSFPSSDFVVCHNEGETSFHRLQGQYKVFWPPIRNLIVQNFLLELR